MTSPNIDPLVESLTRLADNAHWRHYVSTLKSMREAAVRKLLYATGEDIFLLRGEARAFDQIVTKLENHGVKL